MMEPQITYHALDDVVALERSRRAILWHKDFDDEQKQICDFCCVPITSCAFGFLPRKSFPLRFMSMFLLTFGPSDRLIHPSICLCAMWIILSPATKCVMSAGMERSWRAISWCEAEAASSSPQVAGMRQAHGTGCLGARHSEGAQRLSLERGVLPLGRFCSSGCSGLHALCL